MSESGVVILSDQTFRERISCGEIYTLVDFWAEWCNPCRITAKPFSEVAGEFVGRVVFAKLDVDKNPETVLRYAVHSIPTLILFRGAELISRRVGIFSAEQLAKFVEEYTNLGRDPG